MIYYIIGIRRSGLHAIANWLFPMMGEYIYLNNYELGKLQKNELVVNGNFNVIIGIENKPVSEVLKYCNNGKRIWVWRNPYNVLKSQRKWYSDCAPELMEEKLIGAQNLIMQYQAALNAFQYEIIIQYDIWKDDINYRKQITEYLNLQFNDSNKTKVFGYGKSSYDKTTTTL